MNKIREKYNGDPFHPTFGPDGWLLAVGGALLLFLATVAIDLGAYQQTGRDFDITFAAALTIGLATLTCKLRDIMLKASADGVAQYRNDVAGCALMVLAIVVTVFVKLLLTLFPLSPESSTSDAYNAQVRYIYAAKHHRVTKTTKSHSTHQNLEFGETAEPLS